MDLSKRGQGRYGNNSGRGRGRGGRYLGTVDVSNPNRSFTDAEWQTLKQENNLDTLWQMWKKSGNRGYRGQKNNGRFGNRSQGKDSQQRQTSSVTTAQETQTTTSTSGKVNEKGGNNGTAFGQGQHKQDNQS